MAPTTSGFMSYSEAAGFGTLIVRIFLSLAFSEFFMIPLNTRFIRRVNFERRPRRRPRDSEGKRPYVAMYDLR